MAAYRRGRGRIASAVATAGNGDDKRTPSGQQPAARAAAPTPGKMVVRTSESGAGESKVMGAADTAIALNAHTEPELEPPIAPPDEDMLLGTTLLGRYNVTKKIGQGGMGAVYEATHALI